MSQATTELSPAGNLSGQLEPQAPSAAPAQPAHHAMPSMRILAALLGIFISSMMAGLINRVGSLGLVDVQGALSLSADDGSWLNTVYVAGELLITPFATWFAITFSMRRFHLLMVICCTLIAIALPLANNLPLLIALRFIQGIFSGALIPLLMMMALKTLPLHIRLHGLALYAMTATFSPNIALWLTGQWSDGFNDWRLLYWQVIPLCLLAIGLVNWGLPKEGIKTARFKEGNWPGMFFGIIGMCLITIGLTQGVRLEWLNSSLISSSLLLGCVLFGLYLATEWFHPTPFINLRLLGRRNLGVGSIIFTGLLIVLMSGTTLPILFLGAIQDYRIAQSAPLGLIIALPQLILGSLVALLLYKKWVDARYVLAVGLACIAIACFLAAQLNGDWHRDQFITAQIFQAIGQPMAVVPMLFLMTSIVAPHEGPYFSGIINTLRVFGTLAGGAIVGQLFVERGHFHSEMLLNQASLNNSALDTLAPSALAGIIAQQSTVLSIADLYLIFGAAACVLIPLVLIMTHVPAPNLQPDVSTSSKG